MKESAERIQYITDYIISYQSKIETMNKLGLYDTAVLFENFAQKICEFYFGKSFINLNTYKANYPYVDLISDDKKLYIQVTTTQNVPSKIKTTLEKIRDNNMNETKNINELYFVALDNNSISNVKDYINENKIGNIDFFVDKHLITTTCIINKAKCDIDFQIALYDFLKSETDLLIQTGEKLEYAVKISKELINNNIDCYINDEYLIDRSIEIEKIKNEESNFILIQGEAGSGKSALCKLLVQDEEYLLYSRAEKILESNSIEDIWGLDLNKVIRYIKNKRIVIYIDALEFIADASGTKLDLLQEIYLIFKEHKNVYVITSCRTCDRAAFAKLESIYNIKKYDVPLLTNEQILQVANKYEIIQKLYNEKTYIQLLRFPFYLNIIVREIKDYNEIKDINAFRSLIWTNLMCMERKILPNGVTQSMIREAIEKIVFDRVKRFVVGINIEDIDDKIVKMLLSNNMITKCSDNTIRLKYDIYEDICFERYIDKKFDDCKYEFNVFFGNIYKDFGRCIYRRYQIWIENKLFSKENREKFLFKLLTAVTIPTVWKEQTIIGIVKSKFCNNFFEEFSSNISGDLLWEFVKYTNSFAFETYIYNLQYENVFSVLKPIGAGRSCLINIIYTTEVYKEKKYIEYIFKLCSDYSQSNDLNDTIMSSACSILEYYIKNKIEDSLNDEKHHLSEEVNQYLLPIYRMSKVSYSWIKEFWAKIINDYINDDNEKYFFAEDIIKFVLKNTVQFLVLQLPNELCELADVYWIKQTKHEVNNIYYKRNSRENFTKFGLSEKSDSYNYEFRELSENLFLKMLILFNWKIALEWLIKITNYSANYIKKNNPNSVYDIEVFDISTNKLKNYICKPEFWLSGIQENRVPNLIGDGIYLFTKMAIDIINSKKYDLEKVKLFAEYIKKEITVKSNNVMMLSIIAEIGRNCQDIIPGYSLFLATSIDLIMLDIDKSSILVPSADIVQLERMLLMTVGIPELKHRYNIDNIKSETLQNIVMKMQLSNKTNREMAEKILNFLYSKISNQGEEALYYLQIQKMDLRNASLEKVDNNSYAIIPKITGEANEIVKTNSKNKYYVEKNELKGVIDECNSLLENKCPRSSEYLNIVSRLQTLMKDSDFPTQIQNNLIMIIAFILEKVDISIEKRSELCNIWLEGINEIINNKSFCFDTQLVGILYKQIEYELDIIVKEKMKRQILDCLLYDDNNGIIFKIKMQIKQYLRKNEKLSKSLFYTIISIAENKMSNYMYNVTQLNSIGKKIKYQPNKSKPPIYADEILIENKVKLYKDRTNEIVEVYLLQERKKILNKWKIDECDIQVLCYVSNCGLDFNNKDFKMVMGKIFSCVVKIMSSDRYYHDYLNTFSIGEIKEFISNNLINGNDILQLIDMLFDVDFSHISHDVYKLYESISYNIFLAYFDGYNDVKIREKCEQLITIIETKINKIKNQTVRENLYALMFLTLGEFHGFDLNKANTKYSYKDKKFLNDIWSKYGWLHFKNLLLVVEQMHIKELLPEVIISLNESLIKIKSKYDKYNINDIENIINMIITKAYVDFSEEIKSDKELINSFEQLLENLVEFNMEEAAIILDDFRIH